MASNVDIIVRMTDQTKQGRKSIQSGLKDITTTVAKLSGVVAGAAIVMKKAFDLGKQGAMVVQTAESFDLLIEKVGGATDLLDQLRVASAGTIDDMSLMSSTATVLAGVEGDVAKAIADATPQLLEFAKAANKLNPALGDTSFLFQSIATGVKRAQPLILDNLGLTIKLGDAYAAYAEKTGRSVESLSAEEKQLALLNDVMRAGNILVEQVGGNTDSATDAFARLEASTKNIADEFKTKLIPVLSDAAGALELLLTWSKRIDAAFDEQERNVRETSETYEEYVKEMVGAAIASGKLVEAGRENAEQFFLTGEGAERFIERLEELGLVERGVWFATQATNDALTEHERRMMQGRDATEDLKESLEPTPELLKEIEEAAKASAEAYEKMGINIKVAAGAVDTNLTGSIDRFLEKMEFFIAGGGEIQEAFLRVQQALEEGKISPEQAQEFAGELFVAAQELETDLGNITANEAAANIKETLGGSLQDAKERLDSIDQGLMDLPDKITIQIEFETLGGIPEFQGGGIVPGLPHQRQLAFVHGGETVIPTESGGGQDRVSVGPINVSSEIDQDMFIEQLKRVTRRI